MQHFEVKTGIQRNCSFGLNLFLGNREKENIFPGFSGFKSLYFLSPVDSMYEKVDPKENDLNCMYRKSKSISFTFNPLLIDLQHLYQLLMSVIKWLQAVRGKKEN